MKPLLNYIFKLPVVYVKPGPEDKLGLNNEEEEDLNTLPVFYRTFATIDNFGPIQDEDGNIDPDFCNLVSGGVPYLVKVPYEKLDKQFHEMLVESNKNPHCYVVTFGNN